MIWITVDTKLDDEDNCDLTEIMQYVSMLQKSGICKDLIVSSQVPCGTCKEIVHILDNAKINVAYVPENFQLGKSLAYFKKNNTWVIGSDCKEYAKKIKQIINKWCEKPIICNLETAEMVKHAINAFLATTISFSNALAEICVQMGADAYKVAEIMQLDNRIGNGLPLLPGPWFSGGTLARDVKILDSICNKESPVESFFKSIIDINNTRIQYLLDGIKCCISTYRRSDDMTFSPLIKAGAAYQAFRIPAIEAKALGYDDAIFLNNLNFVSETTAASIFMVKDNLIITPPLNAGILDSITRKNIISLAHSKNISVIERNITRVELYTADEIFIAGTLCEITPVLQIDKTIIGGGEVGQITKSMIDTYIGICEGNIKDEWGWLEYVE